MLDVVDVVFVGVEVVVEVVVVDVVVVNVDEVVVIIVVVTASVFELVVEEDVLGVVVGSSYHEIRSLMI